jgi:lactate permease
MQLTLLNWLLALSPVLVILVLMLGLRWGGSKAGAAGWFAAVLVAALGFGAGPRLIGYAQVKGVLLTLDVLYIIWMALLFFHVADAAGSDARHRRASLHPDRRPACCSLLILAGCSSSFLQGLCRLWRAGRGRRAAAGGPGI